MGKGRKRNGKRLGKRPPASRAPEKTKLGISIGTAPGEVLVKFDRPVESVRFNVAQAYEFALGVTNAAEKANREFQDRMKTIAAAVGGEEELAKIVERAKAGAEERSLEGAEPADEVAIEGEEKGPGT